MRFSKISVPYEETKQVNLKGIDLTRKPLGSTVALVGKNGAGKSRVLGYVKNYLELITVNKYFEEHITNVPTNIISQFVPNIQNARIQLEQQLLNNDIPTAQKQNLQNKAIQHFEPFLQRLKQLGQAYIKVVDNDDLKNIKNTINANNTLTFEQILTNKHFDSIVGNPALILQAKSNPQQVSGVLLNEFTAFNSQSTIDYLTKLSNEIATDEFNLYIKNRETPSVINDEIKNKKSFQLFDKFQGYVKQFLGKQFSYQQTTSGNTVNSTLYYNNVPFNIGLLSPGQKTLFAYAILFFYLDTNSQTNIKESIIIIDEPEKHLHPEAQITLINALKSIVSKSGQLWIATHSIHILSHLEFDEILMVKDDELIPPSRTIPGKSFNELMGLDDHIFELTTFINSISEWAYGNFMAQCFKDPEAIFDTNTNDPQFRLFKEFLSNRSDLALLDFGAGKGRTGYTLQEDEEVGLKVSYYAYEPNKTNYEYLNNIPKIKMIYSEKSEIPKEAFDIVLMCNVLHEISPLEWVDALKIVSQSLKSDGYLIILEDRFLPRGESAHEFGYVILGTEETKILLSTDSSVELKLKDPEYQERILFNAFKKNEINPSALSSASALKKLHENAYVNIKYLKKMKPDLNSGRRLANEMQLFLNSKMALEALK